MRINVVVGFLTLIIFAGGISPKVAFATGPGFSCDIYPPPKCPIGGSTGGTQCSASRVTDSSAKGLCDAIQSPDAEKKSKAIKRLMSHASMKAFADACKVLGVIECPSECDEDSGCSANHICALTSEADISATDGAAISVTCTKSPNGSEYTFNFTCSNMISCSCLLPIDTGKF